MSPLSREIYLSAMSLIAEGSPSVTFPLWVLRVITFLFLTPPRSLMFVLSVIPMLRPISVI